MPAHAHAISDISLKGSVSFDLSLRGYNRYDKNDQYGPSGPSYKHHHGTVAGTGSYITPDIRFSADDLVLHTNGLKENSEKTGENRPSYDLIPVLMYIGKPVT